MMKKGKKEKLSKKRVKKGKKGKGKDSKKSVRAVFLVTLQDRVGVRWGCRTFFEWFVCVCDSFFQKFDRK